MKLTHEISKWEHQFVTKSERRRAAKLDVIELKLTIQQLQINNGKLEKHINEWKIIAGEFKSTAEKYCRKMNKIFISLEEVKSKLTCTSIEEHLG